MHHAEDRCHQAFSMAQGYPEGGTQHQAGLDGEVRITSLSTGRGAGGGLPLCNSLGCYPERQVAALLQAGFVLWPVGEGVFCFGNVSCTGSRAK
jgi:hypothetical protein